MDSDNKKFFGLLGGAIFTFVLVFLAKAYDVMPGLVLFLGALSMLTCAAGFQKINPYLTTGGRTFLFSLGVAIAAVFGLCFLSWTMAGILVVATVAVTFSAIATS